MFQTTSDFEKMLENALAWDKNSYRFNRGEHDMAPYSVYNHKDEVIVVHNVLGINKEDLKIITKSENHENYITIAGKTVDAVTGKEYSINSTFTFDDSKVDMSTAKCSMNNGLLYITMKYKKEEVKKKENILKIQ